MWHIVEGAADNTNCTSWCSKPQPGISSDGTHEFLRDIKGHSKVRLYQRTMWNGKIEMVNAPMPNISGPCVVLQMDCDEFWTGNKLEILHSFMMAERHSSAMFWCRYFVGPDIVVVNRNCYTNNPSFLDWSRAWFVPPGARPAFKTHEPPVMEMMPQCGGPVGNDETERLGMVFDHYGYATRVQAVFKEAYYKYTGCSEGWDRIQREASTKPALLKSFFPWSDDKAMIVRI